MVSVKNVKSTPAVMASGTHRDITFANRSSPLSCDCGVKAPPQMVGAQHYTVPGVGRMAKPRGSSNLQFHYYWFEYRNVQVLGEMFDWRKSQEAPPGTGVPQVPWAPPRDRQ